MSYILEALKKSERQRLGEAIPDLQSDHGAAAEARAPLWLVWLVPILGLNALILGWLFLSREPTPLPTQTASPAQARVLTAVPDSRQSAQDSGAQAIPADMGTGALTPDRLQRTKTPAGSRQASPGALAAGPEPVTPSATRSVTAAPQVRMPRPHAEADVTSKEPDSGAGENAALSNTTEEWESGGDSAPLEDLSGGLRGELPDLDISIHAYGDRPAARLVRINGRIYHEGDEVDEDLVLEAITTDGMILEFRGQRIEVPAAGR